MIGLSVSLCILDICKGEVLLSDVQKIIGGTCAKTNEDWIKVIEQYSKTYWKDYPVQAAAILRHLISEGKIDQPRVKGDMPPTIAQGHWLTPDDMCAMAEWMDEVYDIISGYEGKGWPISSHVENAVKRLQAALEYDKYNK